MKFKKITVRILIVLLCVNLIFVNTVYGKMQANGQKLINASVLLYKGDDKYINEIKMKLEKIQEKNKDKINYKFYDGEKKQSVQNSQLEQILKEGTDLILLNIVDMNSAESVINKIKMSNIPVILFTREPVSLESIKSYGKALFIGTDGAEAGIIQGKIINQAWKEKGIYDKNNNDVFQYIFIKGEKDNIETQLRSNYVIMSLKNYGINTLEIASEYCNWDKNYAKLVVKSLFLRYGNSIEGIICNNDEMAEGSIEALHEFGYNMGNLNNNNIIVVGIDGLDAALELIKKKEMTGTVVQNIDEMANALYVVGNNLVQGKDPLYDTKYKFDSSGVAIRIPYSGYVVSKF
ncbi:galactose ABC transporter substrate-binding protein [Clostridium butyricum]|uniref:D-galactose/methyl-galactoside binding periplasmic protein MglB n=1 Tax=Clostridium butyricum E4 str. BoNT E BL5262 TaxID=632245 RepID=C4IGH4_CLOBU|nr:galactose ABC transporter substrate-binding protein [Clostridium butyricum]APF23749.1 periplasmic binding domain protein [Clostridium butyricum]EDT75992.1 ABC-type sugar transport system, periplasmic component [Clostridium butyricum 5521]EEP54113.1 D-galactose-binding periplasmic protein [Clostridium butyricum E4 str. BoNT E BL5262]NFL32520.1 galactose ABC transporter substrate-binding protein [Clostridium butyricum]NFS17187.1 galactose ABC transporter substrate-binding protein [Clostridium